MDLGDRLDTVLRSRRLRISGGEDVACIARVLTDKDGNITVDGDNPPSGGGGSFLSNHTARIDPSGNDSTGTISDLAKPFLTVQSAITKFETFPGGPPNDALIDVGNNQFSEDIVTSLTQIGFKGDNAALSQAFNSLTLTTTGSVFIYVSRTSIYGISSTTASSISCYVENVEGGGSLTNTNGSIVLAADTGNSYWDGDITAGGNVSLQGMTSLSGTVSAPGFTITIRDCLPRTGDGLNAITINSAGSAVDVVRSLIKAVTAAGILTLKDSRVIGTNNATSTVYSDVLLNVNKFNWSSVPTSDPHVIGAPWNNSGILTISAG